MEHENDNLLETDSDEADAMGTASEEAAAPTREQYEASQLAERAAVSRLREALLASEPALEAGMVSGDTLDEVEASFGAATALLAKLREKVAKESLIRVPAGAPGRSTPSPRTAFEKIRDGLGKAG